MSFGEFYVQRECWAKWPRVLIMKRKTGGEEEQRRYVPERTCHIIDHGSTSDDGVDDGVSLFECDACGGLFLASNEGKAASNYCYYCGAKVVEDD